MILYLLPAAIALVLGWLLWRRRQQKARRQALLARPLSAEQRAMIARQVPLLRRLPAELQAPLEGRINLFLDQVEFIGRGGLELREEMRLAIAAQAALLVVNTEAWYRTLRTVLVYPGAFKSRQARHDGYVVREQETVRTGESWAHGPVVLSWAHSAEGAADAEDGHNVVIHEFAHQLDSLSGDADGMPVLANGRQEAEWAAAFTEGYERLCRQLELGLRPVLDPYGAEGFEEYFAVSVEAFFERPAALQEAEPEVYEQLSRFFRLDPASWR